MRSRRSSSPVHRSTRPPTSTDRPATGWRCFRTHAYRVAEALIGVDSPPTRVYGTGTFGGSTANVSIDLDTGEMITQLPPQTGPDQASPAIRAAVADALGVDESAVPPTVRSTAAPAVAPHVSSRPTQADGRFGLMPEDIWRLLQIG